MSVSDIIVLVSVTALCKVPRSSGFPLMRGVHSHRQVGFFFSPPWKNAALSTTKREILGKIKINGWVHWMSDVLQARSHSHITRPCVRVVDRPSASL